MTACTRIRVADEARHVRDWPLEIGLAVIPERRALDRPDPTARRPVRSGDDRSGIRVDRGVEPRGRAPAGAGARHGGVLPEPGGGRRRRPACGRWAASGRATPSGSRSGGRNSDGDGTLIHGWGRRVEVDYQRVVYCTFLRPDADLGYGQIRIRRVSRRWSGWRPRWSSCGRARPGPAIAPASWRQRPSGLSNADRRKDEFIARLAHELRNPLAPICIWTQRLLESDDAPPLVRHAQPGGEPAEPTPDPVGGGPAGAVAVRLGKGGPAPGAGAPGRADRAGGADGPAPDRGAATPAGRVDCPRPPSGCGATWSA